MKLESLSPQLRSCVKVEVAVLGSPFLTVLLVSVDVKAALEEEEEEYDSHS